MNIPTLRTLARCPGVGFEDDEGTDWREGCEDCLRRTASPGPRTMAPPGIIAFECEHRIGPGEW